MVFACLNSLHLHLSFILMEKLHVNFRHRKCYESVITSYCEANCLFKKE